MKGLRKIGLIASGAALASGAIGAAVTAAASSDAEGEAVNVNEGELAYRVDSIVMPWGEVRIDTIQLDNGGTLPPPGSWRTEAQHLAHLDSTARYRSLTQDDYRVVAAELGIETAVIKAVVRIEAGSALRGFYAPGVPIVNFDRSIYNRMKPTGTAKAPASATIPEGIKSKHGRSEWSQLIAARKHNIDKANMGTFWGMFQIGGFHWKRCDCRDLDEFVERMSYSEFEQLELFANFIRNSNMLPLLKEKNWAAFARRYNGPSYAKRGYHTRMASEYARFKKEEQSLAKTGAPDNASGNSAENK